MFEIAFQMFDLNGDGEVSPAEFEKVINIIGHKHCFHFLLGLTMVPRENKSNAYAKFWRDKQRVLWYF